MMMMTFNKGESDDLDEPWPLNKGISSGKDSKDEYRNNHRQKSGK